MATIGLKTRNGSNILMDSTLNTTPALAIKMNGVVYKNALSTTGTGSLAVNINGTRYRTTVIEPNSTITLDSYGNLESINNYDIFIINKTQNNFYAKSYTTYVKPVATDQVMIICLGQNFSSSNLGTNTILNWTRDTSVRSWLRSMNFVAYEGLMENAPLNYWIGYVEMETPVTFTLSYDDGYPISTDFPYPYDILFFSYIHNSVYTGSDLINGVTSVGQSGNFYDSFFEQYAGSSLVKYLKSGSNKFTHKLKILAL